MPGTDADPVRVGSDGGHGGDAKSKAAAPASDQPTAAQSTEDYQGGASGGTDLGVSPPPTRGAGAMFGMPMASIISVVYWGGIAISVIHFILCGVLFFVSRSEVYYYTDTHVRHTWHGTYETRSHERSLFFLVNLNSEYHAAVILVTCLAECVIIFSFIIDLVLCCKYSQMSSSPYQSHVYVDMCAINWYYAATVIYVVVCGIQAVLIACLLGEIDAQNKDMKAHFKSFYGEKYISASWALMVFAFIFVILRIASIFAVCQFKKAAESAHRAAMMTPMHPMGGTVVYGGAGTAGGTTVVVGGPAYGPYGGVGTPYGNAYGPRYY